MRSRPRKSLAISATMLSILLSGFSCSYGDDDRDEKDRHHRKVEAPAPAALIVGDNRIELGLQAAQQRPAERPKG